MLIDSHCHFDFFSPEQQEDIWQRGRSAGVETLVIPAVSRATWPDALAACRRFPIYAGCGLHPIYPHELADIDALDAWIGKHDAIAVGECGLDYAVDIDRKRQQVLFEGQLEIAKSRQLPVIIHARKALDPVLHTLKRYAGVRFVIHTFTGSDQQLAQIFDLGGYIGIGGTSTYPRAQRLQRQLASVPADRYLLETDAPDQPVCGFQGIDNEPKFLVPIAENLARLRQESIEQIHADSTANCRRFFNLTL